MIVRYSLKYFDEIDNPYDENNGSGLVCGDNEQECIDHIMQYYGRENVIEVTLTYIQEDGCDCILPDYDLEEIFKDYFNLT